MNSVTEYQEAPVLLNFEYIYSTYKNKVWVIVCSRIKDEQSQQDVLQEVFTKFFKCMDRFENEKAAVSWLKKTAYTTAVDWIRKDTTYSELVSITLDDDRFSELCDDSSLCSPEEMLEITLLSEMVRGYIDELDDKHREVILLHYGSESLSVNEIADALHIPTQTVYSRHDRAKKLLYDKIDKGGLIK